MKYIHTNIRYLRKEQRLTQSELADKLNIKRSVLGSYEEGRAEPKIINIDNIAKYFGVTIESLVNTDLTISEKKYITDNNNLKILPILIDRNKNEEMSALVPVKATAGYTKGYADIEFIKELPRFSLPFSELPKDKTYRVFQIQGNSMEPVKSGSYIIAEYVQKCEDIKENQCYIVVTKDDGLVYKRINNKLKEQGKLILNSDNPEYKSYSVKADEIIEVWKALGYISFNLPENDNNKITLPELTSMVMNMKKELNRLKK